MTEQTYTTNSEIETRGLAARFAASLRGGEVVELEGDLGSGKTTFVRGVAEALGAKVRVKSPTFTIMNEYPVAHGSIKRMIHLDLYRFESDSQIEALALDDYRRPDTVIFIEWPDKLSDNQLAATHKIKFKFIDEQTRQIDF